MAYDEHAKRLAVKAIGTVESRLDYSAINYFDPITVGIMQWYGVRAAAILCRMRDENPSKWKNVFPTIAADLKNVSSSDPWWNNRGLTKSEGESLRPVMSANTAIQDDQAIADLEDYVQVARNLGIDPDTNTDSMIFFFSMYHQGPVYAFQVVNAVGPKASLAQFHAGALANPVLGQYSNRYNEVYEIIKEGDAGGSGEPINPEPETKPETGTGNIGTLKYVEIIGQNILLRLSNETLLCAPTGTGRWLPTRSLTGGTTDPGTPPDPIEPVDPPPGGGTGTWRHPLPGATLTSGYGFRDGLNDYASKHVGIDLSTGGGAKVLAPFDMKITVARAAGAGGLWAAGGYVKGHSRSGTEYTFSVFHMSSVLVSVGQVISAGTPLGIEGAEGNVTGPHAHIELWPGHRSAQSVDPINDGPWFWGDGEPVDPEPIFRANGVNL